jgi:hypothetical protein
MKSMESMGGPMLEKRPESNLLAKPGVIGYQART